MRPRRPDPALRLNHNHGALVLTDKDLKRSIAALEHLGKELDKIVTEAADKVAAEYARQWRLSESSGKLRLWR